MVIPLDESQAVFFVNTLTERCCGINLLTFCEIANSPLIFSILWVTIDLALGDEEC